MRRTMFFAAAVLAAAASLGATIAPAFAQNQPPQFSPAPPASVSVNAPVAIAINTSDPDGGAVTVTATGLPAGIVLSSAWTVSTIAGSGPTAVLKGSHADGPAMTAKFIFPIALAVSGAGELFVTDTVGHHIRKMDANGVVSTLAGNGSKGFQDGAAATAQFDEPTGIAVDAKGDVIVADRGNGRVRVISSTGSVGTLAAGLDYPHGVATDGGGNTFVTAPYENAISKIDINGQVSTFAGNKAMNGASVDGPRLQAGFDAPTAIALDDAGNAYVSEYNRIRKIDVAGMTSTLAGSGDPAHKDGPAAAAGMSRPQGIAVDSAGEVFFTDGGNHRVRAVAGGVVSTIAGTGAAGFADGAGASAQFNYPVGIALDEARNLYVADAWNHRIRKLTRKHQITGKYSGDPCGGSFPVVVRATDAEEAYVEATIILNVSATTDCIPPPLDVAIAKTGGGKSAVGDPAAFTLVVTNVGPGAIDGASGLVVSDVMPNAVSNAVAASGGADWNCNVAGASVSCAYVGAAVAGGKKLPPIAISSSAKQPGVYENCARAMFTEAVDAKPENNKSCVNGEVVLPAVTYDLSARKELQTFQYPQGLATIFKIDIRNEGPGLVDAQSAIVVKDTLPANFAPPISINPLAQFWTCTPNGLTVTCAYVGPPTPAGIDLPSIVFEAFGKTPGKYENCASVSMKPTDSNPKNNTGCVDGEVDSGLLEIKKAVVDLTGGTPLALYKFPIYLSCSNNPGIWAPVPLAANSSKLSPPSPAGITCSAAENWGAAGPQVPSAKCPSGKASWTPSYFPDSGQGAATAQIPAGGVATIVITNTLKCDAAVPPPSGAQLVVEKVVEESATGLKWKAPFPTGPNTAFAIEVTCPSLNGGKPMSLKVEHQKSETISVPLGEICSVFEPAQAPPSGVAAVCIWEPVKTSYLNVDAGTTSSAGASVTLAKAKAYTVRVTNKAHCLGLGLF